MMLARWPLTWSRCALSTLGWAVLAWAAPAVTGYLLADAAGPQRLAVLAVAVLAVALVGCLAAGSSFTRALPGAFLASRATALRDKCWHVAFLRQRDPDAAGRPRPRAPATAPAAA
jgi:hypothetical protein